MRRAARSLAGILALLTLLASGTVHAQSNGLGISPRKDFTIKHGTTANSTLILDNLSPKQPLQVTIRVVDFKAQNESGTPSLMLATNAPQTPWSLKPFVHVASDVTVGPGDDIKIPFSITVPADQGAGSYYSAIEYTARSTTAKQSLTVAASSATLVFVTVPGKANELLNYQRFGAFIPNLVTGLGTYHSLFTGANPQELAYTLQNNGDVAEDPQGSIVVKNIFGRTVKSLQAANPRDSLALIGQTRLFQVCLSTGQQVSKTNGITINEPVCENPDLLPGRYTAHLSVAYGINNADSQKISASTSFWYLPWWFIITIVVVILVLVGASFYGYRRYKRFDSKA